MELQKVLESRRSIRKYLKKPVEKKDLEKIIEAAILAPSWKNSQVTRYYVVQSDDMLQQVKQCLPEFNQNNVKDAPILIISTIILNRSGYERNGEACNELENGWGYYDCGLHNMNLILKATELGLSTLIMGIRDAKKISELLNIPVSESIVSVIGVGYQDIEPSMPKRKTVEEITKFY
ncbi:MAG: nitroreductase [Coprobacillus sp.]|nr:nitroreductase [Coprobacillus sp.]MCI9093737.1 nitroreductase [Coprobacillus sp.]